MTFLLYCIIPASCLCLWWSCHPEPEGFSPVPLRVGTHMTYFGPQELTHRILTDDCFKNKQIKQQNHSCHALSMDQIASITIKREPGYWTEHRAKSYQQNQRHHGQKGDSEAAFPTSIHCSHGPVSIWQMTENSGVWQACLHTASAFLCADSCSTLHTDTLTM